MTGAQGRYLRTETLVSAAINAVLSLGFVFLVFGRQAAIGADALAADALPQSLAIAFMATLVPTLLTRKRMRAGAVAPVHGAPTLLPGNAFARALLVAGVTAAVAWLLHRVLLPLGPAQWRFAAALGAKTLYGALLGAAVGRTAVANALRDRAAPPTCVASGRP